MRQRIEKKLRGLWAKEEEEEEEEEDEDEAVREQEAAVRERSESSETARSRLPGLFQSGVRLAPAGPQAKSMEERERKKVKNTAMERQYCNPENLGASNMWVYNCKTTVRDSY